MSLNADEDINNLFVCLTKRGRGGGVGVGVREIESGLLNFNLFFYFLHLAMKRIRNFFMYSKNLSIERIILHSLEVL